MLILLFAALLPGLYWDRGPETAPAVKEGGIQRLYVPADQETAWRAAGLTAVACDPARQGFAKAEVPRTEYRINEASATRSPWIDANGWRFLREPGRTWYYDVPERSAALAAAEACAYGVDAVVHTEPDGLAPFGRMLAFLRGADRPRMPSLVNIGVIDDGTEAMGEVLNLMSRRNLLFRVIQGPDSKYGLVLKPKPDEIADPDEFAATVRRKLTDQKRLLRIYGSEVVLARLNGENGRARLHLLNYAARRVNGLRVRVLGEYRHGKLTAYELPQTELGDYAAQDGATEFTIPALDVYGVVDLEK